MPKDNSNTLPLDISDRERLARAVFSPYHIDKCGRIKKEAFKAATGRRDVSVNRLHALDAGECKARSRAIRNPGPFKGFAVIVTVQVRACGSEVVDSRELYLGHADIIHPIVLEKGKPAPAEFNQRLKQMARQAEYYADPDPAAPDWKGEDLSPAA